MHFCTVYEPEQSWEFPSNQTTKLHNNDLTQELLGSRPTFTHWPSLSSSCSLCLPRKVMSRSQNDRRPFLHPSILLEIQSSHLGKVGRGGCFISVKLELKCLRENYYQEVLKVWPKHISDVLRKDLSPTPEVHCSWAVWKSPWGLGCCFWWEMSSCFPLSVSKATPSLGSSVHTLSSRDDLNWASASLYVESFNAVVKIGWWNNPNGDDAGRFLCIQMMMWMTSPPSHLLTPPYPTPPQASQFHCIEGDSDPTEKQAVGVGGSEGRVSGFCHLLSGTHWLLRLFQLPIRELNQEANLFIFPLQTLMN